jgi:hypothetical protein
MLLTVHVLVCVQQEAPGGAGETIRLGLSQVNAEHTVVQFINLKW